MCHVVHLVSVAWTFGLQQHGFHESCPLFVLGVIMLSLNSVIRIHTPGFHTCNACIVTLGDIWQVVKPKLEALRIAEVKLEDAQKELEAAESKLQGCQVQCKDMRGHGGAPIYGG